MLPSTTIKRGVVSSIPYTVKVAVQPTLRGQLSFEFPSVKSFSMLPVNEFVSIWDAVKEFTTHVNSISDITTRYAAGTDGGNVIHLFPIQSQFEDWQPILHKEESFNKRYPGYLTTKNGPPATPQVLDAIQKQILEISGWSSPSLSVPDPENQCLFARLVRGEIPQWRIWEDDHHLAFLTPFANMPGFTVLIPRRHLSSDILSLKNQDYESLVRSTHTVSNILMQAMGAKQVGMFFEGFEINYAHVKLVPVPAEFSEPPESTSKYHDVYPGYLTTQLGDVKSMCDLQFPRGYRMDSSDNFED